MSRIDIVASKNKDGHIIDYKVKSVIIKDEIIDRKNIQQFIPDFVNGMGKVVIDRVVIMVPLNVVDVEAIL